MLRHYTLKGMIVVQNGLHIGGGSSEIKIGGLDNTVIKNPINDEPYIPGSSLKGKMRFLLEHAHGMVDPRDQGNIPKLHVRGKINELAILFGYLPDKNEQDIVYPTRIIVRDAILSGLVPDSDLDDKKDDEIRGMFLLKAKAKVEYETRFFEEKTEVVIDRLSGTVAGAGPRQFERVAPGTAFSFQIVLREFEEGEAAKYKPLIEEGLRLIQNDALGGHGSRGYGRVRFVCDPWELSQ